MPEDKNINILKYWPVIIGILMIAGTWAGIKSHMNNDAIHVGEGENVLTDEEYKNLLRFASYVNNELAEIERLSNENAKDIEQIEKVFYGFNIRFDILYEEHESLEGKVSRNYVELEKKIRDE